ncbi:MAG: dihydrodipicolinate reductase, partial [Chloroflexota bacterium]|nr:dihydrodipicolinate reductase [Chloroflexota bacterium]
MQNSMAMGVIHYGLGPIGIAVARLVAESSKLRSVGAADINPDLLGHDLSELVGTAERSGLMVQLPEQALRAEQAQAVALCTGSALERVLPQVLECIQAGLAVVSTCEELSYPWKQAPQLARQIDEAARRAHVAVLGTGVNPGFAMDYLPIVLSGAARRVDHVGVHRVQDAGVRRLPLQEKVGAGLDRPAFEQRVRAGTVRHVGLPESAYALAAAFGWSLSELRESIEPVLADRPTPSGLGEIQPGRVTGVRQMATGLVNGREVISLILEMAVGLPDPRDEIALSGDPNLRLVIPGGLHGDVATAAIVVNAISRVVEAQPGLRVMADLPPPHP